ncbi:hypothetical protein [Nocardioides sp. Root151]|uniref:hypothetical protein n=1 Tax=Nocardioides sp. Root151 TaxID=1736475 RepID=UPI0007026D90|nr:hypothetical protein [Nocardioides sp. Root151]KQZ75263.1 hypothetical protein ASD66_02525 [Nocardioides sp. Root151]
MRDLDELLTGRIGDAAADVARIPDFDALAARGRRRTTVRRTAAAGAAALAVVTVIGATQWLGGGDPSSEPGPVAPPTSTPSAPAEPKTDHGTGPISDARAEAIVSNPAATLFSLTVDPDDPDSRASVWQLCPAQCDNPKYAVAITDDGYTTYAAFRLANPVEVRSAGSGRFLAERWDPGATPFLLDADGTGTALVADDTEAPLSAGEVVAAVHGSGVPIIGLLAVDPGTGAAHPIPLPSGVATWQQDGERISFLDYNGPTARWTDDGGATWSSHPLDAENLLTQLVPSADPDRHAVVAGGDGATLFPFNVVHRWDGDGAVQRFDQSSSPQAYIAHQAVLPDGRLLIDVEDWSDGDAPTGLHVSAGDDWTRFTPVRLGAPFDREPAQVLGIQAHHGVLTIDAVTADGAVHRSTDAGATWQPLVVR